MTELLQPYDSPIQMSMMQNKLQLTCFGTPQASLNGQLIATFQRAKAQALLIYLAVEQHQPHRRSTLSGLLWPDYAESRARRNFSQALNSLGKTIQNGQQEPPFLDIGTHMIAINAKGDHWVDIMQFETLLAKTRSHNHNQLERCPTCTQSLQEAIDLYSGPFLQGYELADSDLFEQWIETTRERLHRQVLDAFTQLIQSYAAQSRLPDALAVAHRLLALAPWQEEAHRQLMRLLAQSGQRTQALAQYEQCAQMLMDELGVSPSPVTDKLYDQILAGEFSAESATTPRPSVSSQPLPTVERQSERSPAPFQATPTPPHFVGRSKQIETICAALNPTLEGRAETRVVALVGMGGVGKTTLAARIAHEARSDFQDGILWSNAAISAPSDILDLWGRAYGYDFSSLSDLESRASAVRDMLVDKQTLIVLDNVEDAADIRSLLPNGEGCAVLITTRSQELAVALNAKIYVVGALQNEEGVALLNRILGEERVAVAYEQAVAICTQLHCLPLAVEIAAQRLKSRPRMKLAAMVKRLHNAQQRLDLNISDQAVRNSFAVSWDGLDKELQQLFALQGIFQGQSFTAEALAALIDMDPFDAEEQMYTLVTLSLLNEEPEESHYRQHPLLADFAQEKLAEIEVFDMPEIQTRLVDYYLGFAEKNQKNYELLQPDWGNLMVAIEMAYQLEQWVKVVAFTDFLTKSWLTQGRYRDARQAYQWAQEATEKLGNQQQQAANLFRWGDVCTAQAEHDKANQYLSESLALYMHIEEDAGIADAQFELARIAIERSQSEKAEQLLQSCLQIRHALDDREGIAGAIYYQAWLRYTQNELDTVDELLSKALEICERVQGKQWLAPIFRLYTLVAIQRQEYTVAHQYCEQVYTLVHELQNENELAMLYVNWARLYRMQGLFDQAKTHGEYALSLLHKLGLRRSEGMVRYQLGATLTELREWDEAKRHLFESIKIFEQTQDKLGKLIALDFLGDLYQRLELQEKGRDAWLEAQVIAQELNIPSRLQKLAEKLESCQLYT